METTKKYEFRALCSADIFPIFNILNKIGFKQFKDCFKSDEVAKLAKKDKKDVSAIGVSIAFDIAGVILANIQHCENDLYRLLSSVSNLNVEEIKALSMAEFAEMIVDFVKKPEFGDFFKVVSKLFK